MNVIKECLRSWIFVSLGWINNADQTLDPFKLARVKTELESRVGRRLLSRVYAGSGFQTEKPRHGTLDHYVPLAVRVGGRLGGEP